MFVTAILLAVLNGPPALSLVPSQAFSTCLSNPLDLVPDPEDCHIFYQCDLNPQPMSCGDMMFNSLRQVCDWPSTVLQLRPECRQEEQFSFSDQMYPYHRTLRMLNFFGDGNQFSQKRLRAPQDVGLGRQKNFGNREYFGQENDNRKDEDVEYDDYDYYKRNTIDDNDQKQMIEVNSVMIHENEPTNLDINNRILEEIRSRLPQIVQNSISNFVQNDDKKDQEEPSEQNQQTQAVSTPAHTVRLKPQEVPTVPVTRPAPTPYIELQQVATQPQGPSFVYQQVYPEQVDSAHSNVLAHSPAHVPAPAPAVAAAPAPALTPAPGSAPAPAPVHVGFSPPTEKTIPAEAPLPSIPEITPANTVQLRTKNIPTQPNKVLVQSPLSGQNQPKLAPILMEDTREFKPVWTVTRERPRQILLKYRTRHQQQQQCVDKNCPKLRQRVLRKIKRKLIVGEKQQLEERRRQLIQDNQEEMENTQTFEEDAFDSEEQKAITLKEAYDRAIKKVEKTKKTRPAPGNLLHEILNRDFGTKKDNFGEYVSSDDLRYEDIGGEFFH